MSAAKIKNLVILILLLVNLVLLALVVPTRLSDRQRSIRADEALVQLYANADVTLRIEDIPKPKALYPMDIPMSRENVLPTVRAVLGEELLTQEDAGVVSYSSAVGTATLSADGTLTATLSQPQAKTPEALLKELGLSQNRMDTEMLDTATICTVTLEATDVPIVTHSLRFRYENDLLTEVSGLLLPEQGGTIVSGQACLSARDALTAFLGSRISTGWVGDTIDTVEQGYALSADTAQSLWHLQPVWHIATDAGDYLVDGLSGTVTPML